MLGDLCGFGLGYFDFDESRGYVRTATEVSSGNSALMRNIRRHENALEGAITGIARAVMGVSRGFGESIPDDCCMRVQYDDSIVQDTAVEKDQDMREVGVTMAAWSTASSGMARRSRLPALGRLRLVRVPSNGSGHERDCLRRSRHR